jgi:site-specific recombinase XerD
VPQRKTASNGSQTSPIPGEYGAEVAAFGRSLRARNRSAKTIRSYLDTANLFGQYLIDAGETTDFATITKAKVETFITDQLERWSASTAATRYRCLQQFFRFLVDNEVIADSPMARMSPPAIPEAPVPVFTNDELIRLRKACEGRGFSSRRDFAIMRLFIDTPIRLGEMAGIRLEDLDLEAERVIVTGKGNRAREMPLGPKVIGALDDYLRERRRHVRASEPWLWLGVRGRLTDSGIAQILERRAEQAHVAGMHAHRFRHTFSHRWLAAGKAEGDLQRLAGWRSAQMLQRYGASAADARARDAYWRSALWQEV